MPDAGYAFQGVNLVTSVEEGDIGDFSHVAAVLELFGLEFIVVLASLEKTLQKATVRDANLLSYFEFSVVETLRFSHVSSSLSSALSILPIPARQRQLFRHWAESIPLKEEHKVREYRER